MKQLFTAALVVLLINHGHNSLANDGSCKPACGGDACCYGCGPAALYCQPEVSVENIERYGFEVECKPICIPPVQLPNCRNSCLGALFGRSGRSTDPCSTGCTNDCGPGCVSCNKDRSFLGRLCCKLIDCRIRSVNTFSKKEYECGQRCVVKWNVVCVPTTGCGKCGVGCMPPNSCCAPLSR